MAGSVFQFVLASISILFFRFLFFFFI
uniref:Uncharacterized protein n=1 Tax=Rhizophora mucronata TaxID=61149 RepID=A0A2P2N1G7_RHIMU